jgi:hypothetical protein
MLGTFLRFIIDTLLLAHLDLSRDRSFLGNMFYLDLPVLPNLPIHLDGPLLGPRGFFILVLEGRRVPLTSNIDSKVSNFSSTSSLVVDGSSKA